jgi:exopolysaccharide biosynthesis WecB/TagA/CpsF family protein
VVERVFHSLDAGRGGWIITVNTDLLLQCTRDPELLAQYERADLRVADGLPLIWAARLQGTPLPDRVAGSDLVWLLADAAAKRQRSLFLLGGDPGAAEGAAAQLRKRMPGIRIVGWASPSISTTPTAAEVALVRATLAEAQPDLIYFGLGSPKTERLISALVDQFPAAWMVGVGISLSFMAGLVARAPAWMQRAGLEWLHRLLQHPGRLARRYLIEDLPFAARLLAQSVRRRGASTVTLPLRGELRNAPAEPSDGPRGAPTSFGVVVIGRNEGKRLARCLRALGQVPHPLVYVDSGSSDRSVELALSHGLMVWELDPRKPFTAARARNEGFRLLLNTHPQLDFVQFLDGDCELVEGWLTHAAAELASHPTWGVVCGRRRERFPDASIYNRLCDIEWDTPVGETRSCGGDAMMRVSAFEAVNGFDPEMIAGEEPELCVRLRQHGWKVVRLPAEMDIHDAAIERFRQWWKRNERSGHAYAEGYAMHGGPPERHFAREVRSNWWWGLLLPVLALGLAQPTRGLSLFMLVAYPLLALRIFLRVRRTLPLREAAAFASFTTLGKFPHAMGQARFLVLRLLNQRSGAVDYKSRGSPSID